MKMNIMLVVIKILCIVMVQLYVAQCYVSGYYVFHVSSL